MINTRIFIKLQDEKKNFAAMEFDTVEEAEEWKAKDNLKLQQKNKDGLMSDDSLRYWRGVKYVLIEVTEVKKYIKTI